LSFREFDLKSLITGESDFVGISNYVNVLGEATFRKAATNTLIFLIVSMSVQYAIGLALALFFVRSFPLSKVLRAMLVLPWLAPAIVATTAWRFIFREPLGFMNQVLATLGFGPIPWLTSPNFSLAAVTIVNIWIGITFNMVLLHSGLQSIPQERLEAAEIDGASFPQKLRYIIMPALRPVTAIVLTLGFIYTMKQFDIIWTLTTGGPGDSSQVLSTWSYTLTFLRNDFGEGAAVAGYLFAASVVVVSIYSLAQRRNIRATQ
jgi:multiple sugar transport system permease protein